MQLVGSGLFCDMSERAARLKHSIKFSLFTHGTTAHSGPWPPLSRVSHTTHTRYDSSGRVISLTQKPLPDSTQHSQESDIHAPSGIRTHNPSKQVAAEPHHATTGVGFTYCYRLFFIGISPLIFCFRCFYLLPDQALLNPCKNSRDFLYEYLCFLRINHLWGLICLIACIHISQKVKEDHKRLNQFRH
jgi:hypothetical protein